MVISRVFAAALGPIALGAVGADGTAHALRGAESIPSTFSEDGYSVVAPSSFMSRCVPEWQAECRRTYGHKALLQQKLCETHLDRNYVKIRTMFPQHDILRRWAQYKPWVDFDRGWFAANLPRFTKTGFKKAKLPDELHRPIQDWYRRSRAWSQPESSQPAFGFNCNTGYDNDDWVTTPPRELTEGVRDHIQQLLKEWTGQNVNENTAMYGIREYHRGSICGLHVDAHETHAFSAIYQVDQLGMDKPWASNYVTHSGEEGREYLLPGEILLYESASSLHGRAEALAGDEFANMFFHFRSPEWVPAVRKMMETFYWPDRQKHEQEHGRLVTSAEPEQKDLDSDDECFEIRDRKVALMQEGRFTEPPPAVASHLRDGDDL